MLVDLTTHRLGEATRKWAEVNELGWVPYWVVDNQSHNHRGVELRDWLVANMKDRCKILTAIALFETYEDAMLYYLTWG